MVNKRNQDAMLKELIPSENSWTPIDEALYAPKEFYNLDTQNAEELKFKAIKYSFKQHYTNNQLYKRLCKDAGSNPDDVKHLGDLEKIPLIPDSFFKDYPEGKEFVKWLDGMYTGTMPTPHIKSATPSYDEIIDSLDKIGVNIMFTSGTGGRFSFVPRDELSEQRLKYSVLKSLSELFAYEQESNVALLTPNPLKCHLAIARFFGYALDIFDKSRVHIALEDTVITTEFLNLSRGFATGISGKLKSKLIGLLSPAVQRKSDTKMINLIENWNDTDENVYIAGPPFWLDRIITKMEEEGRKVTLKTGHVITGGGWKIYEDKRTPEEVFRERIGDILGIPEKNCRDAYAMTECNALFMSCEGHYKHIPSSFIHVFVLDENLQPVGYNEYGRMAFLDSLANSYPGFIITGDRVKILEECPECGRPGPVLDTEVQRLPGIEGRGCALVMQEMLKQSTMED